MVIDAEHFSTLFVVDNNMPQDFSGRNLKYIGNLKKELLLFPLINLFLLGIKNHIMMNDFLL